MNPEGPRWFISMLSLEATPPEGNLGLSLLLLVVLILVNAFFAMSEIAVISLNDNKLRKDAAAGDKRANILVRLTSDPSRFLATIQVGVTLSGLLSSAVAADTFADYIVFAFSSTPIPPEVVRIVSLFVITIILSCFTLIFGELVPKRIAMNNCEKISYSVARFLKVIYAFERPFVAFLSAATNGVVKLFGVKEEGEDGESTEEEIRMMVDAGSEKGFIPQSEKDMILNIFEFDDKTADELMTHRTDMIALELGTPLEEVIALSEAEGFSRIPVYEGSLDHIVGILYVKDLLRFVSGTSAKDFDLSKLMRKPLYVPETNHCKELLEQLKAKKTQMAIVVDEYGGTSGLITMEDLLESIVGSIQDEYDNEEEEISRQSDTVFSMDGTASLEEVERLLKITFPEDADCDTLGGYIIYILGTIPQPDQNASITVGNVEFTVTESDERRINKIRAVILPPNEKSGEE